MSPSNLGTLPVSCPRCGRQLQCRVDLTDQGEDARGIILHAELVLPEHECLALTGVVPRLEEP